MVSYLETLINVAKYSRICGIRYNRFYITETSENHPETKVIPFTSLTIGDITYFSEYNCDSYYPHISYLPFLVHINIFPYFLKIKFIKL
jgi:hypothetical protein